jgi:glucosyl-dolichyl phosphate glucuronosyltransferase
MNEPLLLSIATTSYTMERLKDVIDLLNSVENQTYSHVETIIIVEKSEELLRSIEKYVAENIHRPIKVIFNNGEKGLSAARNLGVQNAAGDVIAFIDDDATILPDWAAETIKTYADSSIIGITGPILPDWQDEVIDWFPKEFDWILSCSGFSDITDYQVVRNAFGTNMSFRREAFISSGSFLTNLGAKGGGTSGKHELVGDEAEFSIRIVRDSGKHILFNPKVRVKHKVYKYRITPSFIARRAYWEGYTKALFRKSFKRAENDKNVLNVEHQLLKRIIGKLLPRILGNFFIRPAFAWRTLFVTTNATFFVGLGYFNYSIQSLAGHGQTIGYEKENIDNGT